MDFHPVMIDGSHLPYDENVELTEESCRLCPTNLMLPLKANWVYWAGIEDDVKAEHHTYTDPDEVVDFVSRTGVDSLAIFHWNFSWPPINLNPSSVRATNTADWFLLRCVSIY